MSIGTSGRIVLEIDTELKRKLYANLASNGLTLKEWFQQNANLYIARNASEDVEGESPAGTFGEDRESKNNNEAT